MLDELCEQLGELVGVDEPNQSIWFADGEVRVDRMADDTPSPLRSWQPIYDPEEAEDLRRSEQLQVSRVDMFGSPMTLPEGAFGWELIDLHFIVSPRGWLRLLKEIKQSESAEREWLTLKQVGYLLQWSPRTIMRMLAEAPDLPGRPLPAPGRKRSDLRWHRDDLRCFLEAYRVHREDSAAGSRRTKKKGNRRERRTRPKTAKTHQSLTALAKQLRCTD
jgi:hypothetical protein